MFRQLSFAIQWHITSACPNHCRHCYMFDRNYTEVLSSELDLKTQKNFIKNLKVFENKYSVFFPKIIITGGDPLIKENWFEFIHFLKNDGRYVEIMGVPETITDNNINKLKKLNIEHFQMSLDGMEFTHDFIRGVGSFKRTLHVAKKLLENGIRPIFSFTLHDKNAADLIPLINTLVKELPSFLFAFDFLVCGGEKNFENKLTPNQILTIFENYLQLKKELKKVHPAVQLIEKSHLFAVYHNIMEQTGHETGTYSYIGGCYNGFSSLAVLANGDIMPCRRLNISIGNYMETSFEDIFLNNLLMKQFRRREYFIGCADCEHYMICRGCPAISYGESNNCFSKPSTCFVKELPSIKTNFRYLAPPPLNGSPQEEMDYILRSYDNQLLLQKKQLLRILEGDSSSFDFNSDFFKIFY